MSSSSWLCICVMLSASSWRLSESFSIFFVVAMYSSCFSLSYVCTFFMYSALFTRSEKLSADRSSSSSLPLPDSYMYWIRFFISSYCWSCWTIASSRSMFAWSISSCFFCRSASSVLILSRMPVSSDWSETTSSSAAALSFCRSSTEGVAKTGLTATSAAVIKACAIFLFIFSHLSVVNYLYSYESSFHLFKLHVTTSFHLFQQFPEIRRRKFVRIDRKKRPIAAAATEHCPFSISPAFPAGPYQHLLYQGDPYTLAILTTSPGLGAWII